MASVIILMFSDKFYPINIINHEYQIFL